MGKNQGIPLVRMLIAAGLILFLIISVIQFIFGYYPKNCIFFEFDFSKECRNNTWEFVTGGNQEKLEKGGKEALDSYIDYRVERAENKAERIQENLNNRLQTNTGTTNN